MRSPAIQDGEARPRTMFAKIWDAHVASQMAGRDLLLVDRHLVNEATSVPAFDLLAARNLPVRSPGTTLAVLDHMVATHDGRRHDSDPQTRDTVARFRSAARANGLALYDLDHPGQGIVHVVAAETGAALPGSTIVCGDSHTCTNGALGAVAFGIGTTDVAHVLAHRALWMRRPLAMRVMVSGRLAPHVTAKDVALALIAAHSTDGGTGFAVEYAGEAVRAMAVEARMTLCNLSIEFGARIGLVAPDEAVFAYLKGRPLSPRGAEWERAVEAWLGLPSDRGAVFDREIELDGASVAPMVTWGNSPEDALPVDAAVPDPSLEADASRRERRRRALDYTGLRPGQPLVGTAIDVAFVGSCTNARIGDLREAAAIVRGRHVPEGVRALVVPGSMNVKRQAEAEGLDAVFRSAGFEWHNSGCSLCVSLGPDVVGRGMRCASTSNRNFEHRQGPGAITHLMSPAMVAAAAVTGVITDVRRLP